MTDEITHPVAISLRVHWEREFLKVNYYIGNWWRQTTKTDPTGPARTQPNPRTTPKDPKGTRTQDPSTNPPNPDPRTAENERPGRRRPPTSDSYKAKRKSFNKTGKRPAKKGPKGPSGRQKSAQERPRSVQKRPRAPP